MKYVLTVATLLFVLNNSTAQKKVNWMHWDDAVAAATENPKKIYIDVYTDWCGYCKKMDRETFTDPSVIKYLNTNFYPVKLDAEQKESINFNGTEFKHRPGGRGGVHELAVALLNNQMGYPAFVILDEEFSRILISPGYKGAADVMMEMEFANNETYKVKSWNVFKAEQVAMKRAAAAAAAKQANPTVPASTAKPTTPAKPASPTKNGTETKPAMPAKPAVPTKATTPSKPASPNERRTAAKPAAPEAPANTKARNNNTRPPLPPQTDNSNNKYENEIFKVVSDMPRFPGCEDSNLDKNAKSKCSKDKMNAFINDNLKYPKAAKIGKLEGLVVVQFEVSPTGELLNPRVVRDIGGNCGEEALRVVKKMPTWIPGKQRDRAVTVQYTLPVKFQLDKDSSDDSSSTEETKETMSKKEMKLKKKEEKKKLKLNKAQDKM